MSKRLAQFLQECQPWPHLGPSSYWPESGLDSRSKTWDQYLLPRPLSLWSSGVALQRLVKIETFCLCWFLKLGRCLGLRKEDPASTRWQCRSQEEGDVGGSRGSPLWRVQGSLYLGLWTVTKSGIKNCEWMGPKLSFVSKHQITAKSLKLSAAEFSNHLWRADSVWYSY